MNRMQFPMRRAQAALALTMITAAAAIGCAGMLGGRYGGGDVAKGREAFQEARCFTCHVVPGEDFLPPVVDPAITLNRGWAGEGYSVREMAKLIEQSHARRPRAMEEFAEDPPPAMGVFTDSLSDEQRADIIAYLRAEGE